MIAFGRLRGVGIVANNEDGNDDDSADEDVDHDYDDSDRESGVGAILLCSRG